MGDTDWIRLFIAAVASRQAPDALELPGWRDEQWQSLLAQTSLRTFRASEVVIQRDGADRTVYLVAGGALEVGVVHVDGVSMTSLARITAGSIIGEQSFFDGQPRSASVWAVSSGAVLQLPFDAFRHFGEEHPALARDFVFAMARVLSIRLRNTSFRLRR